MSEAHRRPKDPETVRSNIIAATADLLSFGEPLSMAIVAERAGVTKGAVQHHFGTREALLAAMSDSYLAQFESQLAADADHDDGPGAAARSYVRTTVQSGPRTQEESHWRAILVASVIDRSVAARWSTWVAASRAQDPPRSTAHLIMRLAADGLWLSDLLGTYSLSKKERTALLKGLLELEEQECTP